MKYSNILYIDVGNTAIKFGIKNNNNFVFIKNELIKEFQLQNIISCLQLKNFDLIVYSSVKPSLNNTIIEIANQLKIKIYNIKTLKLKPIFNFLEKKFLGDDLVCLIAGAISEYGSNNIIVSMGTATTISLLVEEKFLGVIIIPGLALAANALFKHAELLKDFNYSFSDKKINRSTTNALNLGIVNSAQIIIEHWIGELQKEYTNKKFNVIFTGGNINKMIINSEYKKDEYLVFKGLEFYCKKNKLT